MAPFMTHMLSLRHILLQTSCFSPNRNLFHCWDESIYPSSSSRCFRISLHTFLKSYAALLVQNKRLVFPPGLNKMSSDAQSLEEIGWAAQAPLLNGKLAEGGKTSRATERRTQTDTTGCRGRSSGHTYTQRRTP